MPTFYDRFRECAERWPGNFALEIQRRDRMESYTYAEVRQMAESIGCWLTENKFPQGTRIAILADNHPRWVAAYLGIIAAGCTTVPLLGNSMPAISLINVDLPQPDGPMRQKNSPSTIEREKSSTTFLGGFA